MRNRIFGAIGVVLGGLAMMSLFREGWPQGNSSRDTGGKAAIIFGAVLIVVGLFYLIKGGGPTKNK